MSMLKTLAAASVLAVCGPAFAGFDHIITFDEAPLGTNADGLEIANARFSFIIPGRGSGASVGVGPGVTPYTNDPGIEGDTRGTLGVEFLKPVSAFGFGYAFSTFGYIQEAVSVKLFDPEGNFITTIIGSAESPMLRGEGEYAAGYVSGLVFGSIGSLEIDFADFIDQPRGDDPNPGEIGRFLFDNLGYDIKDSVVPLPTPAFLGGAGLMGLVAVRRRRAM